jgi:uncharacterized protein (TIGR03382 family)
LLIPFAMNNQKLFMFAVAGLLLPAADAAAELRAGKTTMIIPHPANDKAPVTGTPLRLRRTDSEQAGNEHLSTALFGDGKSGLFFSLSTELNGQAATHRAQLAVVPFSLVQGTDGAVSAQPDMTKARFATANRGDEYRNAHASAAFAIDGGASVCAEYNYQPANTGDTKRYLQCFAPDGTTTMQQTEIFAKQNDDCSMAEVTPRLIDKNGATERYVAYRGCNGNGRDDGWVSVYSVTKTATGYTAKRDYDLSVIAQEERSRGDCVVGTDTSFALCSATQGNTQPQREGTWMFAIDLTPGKYQGANQQNALLWRKQMGGRQTVNGVQTYAMRAMIVPVLAPDGKATDMVFYRHGAVQGNNNDNRKGGQYIENMLAVVKATRAGMSFVTPMSGQAFTSLLAVDGTHNENLGVLIGNGADLKPALLVHNGRHTGGNGESTIRAISWDQAAGATTASAAFKSAATLSGPPADRHLYSNYLGNNPGNQGRNHTVGVFAANPFFGQGGNNDKYLALYASSGKGDVMDPAIKLAGFLSVIPVASGPAAQTGGTSGGTTGGGTTDPGTDDGGSTDDGSDATLGGCSTGGSAGLATFLLIGLAAFIRRRR